MERAISRRSGLLPVGLLSGSLPLLVLYGSATFTTAQLAVLQLCVVWAVQIVAVFLKIGTEQPKEVKPVAEPAVVEVVQVADDERQAPPTLQAVATERNTSARTRQREVVLEQQPQVLESQLHEEDLVKPVRPAAREVAEHPLYSNAMLDSTLRHFLAVLDPSQLAYLSESPDPTTLAAPVPLDSWKQLLNTPGCRVALHPTIPHLYSISASYPDVPLRNLWELMIDIKNRPKWDSMCYAAEDIDSIGLDQGQGAVRQAAVDYLATKGMFPVKANDMVLLSVNARLQRPGPVRLVCATTSVGHPSKPVYRSYTRMSLAISGFLAEDDGQGGCRVTQLTDLSALASWVPSRIVRMVTETMIPKSLVKIGETAKGFQVEGPRALLHGEDWYPPTIGAWDAPLPVPTPTTLLDPQEIRRHHKAESTVSSASTLAAPSTVEHEREPDDDLPSSEVDHLRASSARDIRELVSQLRSVNNRLSTLERRAATSVASDKTSHDADSSSLAKPTYTHPPPAPFGVSKVTDNALAHSASAQPMGWLARIADTLSFRTFLGGLGAGIFSTTTAATLAALVVFYIRKKKL